MMQERDSCAKVIEKQKEDAEDLFGKEDQELKHLGNDMRGQEDQVDRMAERLKSCGQFDVVSEEVGGYKEWREDMRKAEMAKEEDLVEEESPKAEQSEVELPEEELPKAELPEEKLVEPKTWANLGPAAHRFDDA
ncbi:hypothetical protein E4T42_02798 [Aureobasidium subglaciale]|nr:hypothetical protein E4T38_03939 [Aureobasidium subglaciale]KAI5225151.1 hypothetical protein E4T40_03714 [Aureobasidium subglaciale]KAI5228763.1 hypothetical protein E4T41_03779 [Aureobasidium subglaciale]KAI5253759.1 hypothetical protein E4T42_02798 [Aureobasidium subglaciale]KAI5263692.1 hypothetical protein E4T46_03555 [Aureobasidium subglaciale]